MAFKAVLHGLLLQRKSAGAMCNINRTNAGDQSSLLLYAEANKMMLHNGGKKKILKRVRL